MAIKWTHIMARFVVIFLIVFVLFYPTKDAGFVTDFTGLYPRLLDGNMLDALKSFGFPALMPILNLALFFLFKTFGLSGAAWLLFSSFFFSLGLLAFSIFVQRIMGDYKIAHAPWIIYGAVLMVIVHPSSVEAMVWKVALGHTLSICFFMWALVFVRLKSAHSLMATMVCLAFSLLCFEWAIVFPFVVLTFALFERNFIQYKWTLIASVIIVLLYFVLTKWWIGSWVGHYGVDGSDFKPLKQVITGIKHWVKNVFFVPFYPSEVKQSFYAFLSPTWISIAFSFIVMVAGWFIYRSPSLHKKALFIFFMGSMLGLVLVSHLHFVSSISENDRYASLMLPFLTVFLTMLFFSWGKKLGVILCSLYLILAIFFQRRLIAYWSFNQELLEQLVHDYPCEGQQTLILNAPENYKGTFMLRDYNFENPLIDHFAMYGKDLLHSTLVAQSNIAAATDRLEVEQMTELEIKLKFNQWGNWWWRKGQGAQDYSTPFYKVDFKGQYYVLTLDPNHPFECIIYADSFGWYLLN